MRKSRTKKDIIKDISIVFLVIMLVLTFFSNTILNWSLPQVSGRYTEYGEIKTGVRGSGTVVSNMTYTETIKGSRTIEEVFVNRGKQVEEGDILMRLSPTESDAIDALKAEIESLEDAYTVAILSKTETSYYTDEVAIQHAEEDLALIKDERALFTDEYVASVKKNAEDAEKALEEAQDKVALLEEKLNEITDTSDEPEIVKAREEYDTAQKAYDSAKKALEDLSYTDTSGLEAQRESLYDSLSAAETRRDRKRADSKELLEMANNVTTTKKALTLAITAYDQAVDTYEQALAEHDPENPESVTRLENATAKKTEAETAKNEAQSAYDEAERAYNDNKSDIIEAQRAIEDLNTEITGYENEIYYLRMSIAQANTENREYNGAKTLLENREKTLAEKKETLDKVVKQLNKATSDELKLAKKALDEATEVKAEADKELLKLDEIEALDEQIKTAERSLQLMKYSLEQKKKSDEQSNQLDEYNLNKQLDKIRKKKEELKELQGNSKEGYELRASHSGTVTEVNFKPGELATDGAGAVVIQVVESGYSISFSVSNTDAQKVKIGDTATVSDTYWGQKVGATLTSIVPDSGGKTKTLNFDLSGDVNVGQTLTLLVGEKSTGYSSVIPKNALHEDSNGKFIYITKTKSTPLGNRYVATRLDVTVAASDDKNVAIVTDDTYLYEYVILSSTKPFEAGEYVRLSD